MKFKAKVETANDLFSVLEACKLLRQLLSGSSTGFERRVRSLLAEKHGGLRFWAALHSLEEFLRPLAVAPCEVEVGVTGAANHRVKQ